MELTAELIECITRQVVAALGRQEEVASGPRALLVGNGDWDALRSSYGLEGVEAYETSGSLDAYDFVLLDDVAPALLADLALGRGSCPGARAVSEALLSGKGVYLAAEGLAHRRYQHQANPRYYAMLEEYTAQLGRFGVCVAPKGELVRKLTHVPSHAATEKENRVEAPGLLTAEEARKLCRSCGSGGVLQVAAGTVITPLARDVLREKNVSLEEKVC